MNGRRHSTQRGWVLPVLAVLVAAAGTVAGLGIRELDRPAAIGGPATTSAGPTTTTGPPPGSGIVELSPDAKAHPQADAVRALLQRHFDAINNHDYPAWTSTVVRERIRGTTERDWRADYLSTRDGSVRVHRIEPSQKGTVVLLSFTSTQDAKLAPTSLPGSTCTNWWVSYRVVVEGGQQRIDAGIRHASVKADCTAR